MDIPLKHVIGTVALIGLIISVTLAYTIITSYIEADVTKKQLNQIAEHIALNLVEIITLTNFASSRNPMMKILKLPLDLGGKAYFIELVNETIQGYGCYIHTQLVTRKDVYANSPIPLNSTQTQTMLVTTLGGNLTVRWEPTKRIYYSKIVYGGAQDIVVWAGINLDISMPTLANTTTFAGIGLWKT